MTGIERNQVPISLLRLAPGRGHSSGLPQSGRHTCIDSPHAAVGKSQLRDYQARLGKPFLHDAYLSELTELRDQLKTGLSAAAHESGNEGGPSVSELADRIKALKAAHSIEATPQRVRQKQSTAEEPVTARIRRRTEATPISDPAVVHVTAPEAGTAQPPEPSQNSSIKPPPTFQERIAMERQSMDREPSLS